MKKILITVITITLWLMSYGQDPDVIFDRHEDYGGEYTLTITGCDEGVLIDVNLVYDDLPFLQYIELPESYTIEVHDSHSMGWGWSFETTLYVDGQNYYLNPQSEGGDGEFIEVGYCGVCDNEAACNFGEEGACIFAGEGLDCAGNCNNEAACNFGEEGACIFAGQCVDCEGNSFYCEGCTDSSACNYDEFAQIENNTCYYYPELILSVETLNLCAGTPLDMDGIAYGATVYSWDSPSEVQAGVNVYTVIASSFEYCTVIDSITVYGMVGWFCDTVGIEEANELEGEGSFKVFSTIGKEIPLDRLPFNSILIRVYENGYSEKFILVD